MYDKSEQRVRGNCLELALRMPHQTHESVLTAATAFESYIFGSETKSNLPPHQQRLIREYKDLMHRASKLMPPTLSDNFDPAEKERLGRQYAVMLTYADVLKERIDNFPKEPA